MICNKKIHYYNALKHKEILIETDKKNVSFMLKTVNMEKVADKCYMLVLQGKRHDTRN